MSKRTAKKSRQRLELAEPPHEFPEESPINFSKPELSAPTSELVFTPGITYRLNVTSLECNVDRALRFLPKKLDLSTEAKRTEFRDWLIRFSESLAWNLRQDLSKAAELGMEQMTRLIRDPKYREIVREREARVEDRGKSDIVKRVRQQRRKIAADKRLEKEGVGQS